MKNTKSNRPPVTRFETKNGEYVLNTCYPMTYADKAINKALEKGYDTLIAHNPMYDIPQDYTDLLQRRKGAFELRPKYDHVNK